MKAMNVEKKILNGIKIDDLVNIQANEYLTYREEAKGKRALGFIRVSGQFLSDEKIRQYEENIEVDIFAPLNKCSEEPFVVRLVDVNGIVDEGLMIYLDFEIEGLKEENQEASCVIKQENDEISVDCIEDLFEDNQNVYTSCRLIIAKNDDTYESIAKRYEIEEALIRELNKNQPILPKQCVLIP